MVVGAPLTLAFAALLAAPPRGPESQTLSVVIETQKVTRQDVVVSPDGGWLVFTALGHLFRLPAGGGL